MKKRVVMIALCVLTVLALAIGLTGCKASKQTAKLLEGTDDRNPVTVVDYAQAINGYNVNSIDGTGVLSVSKVNSGLVTYGLYATKSQTFVSGNTPYIKVADGIYYGSVAGTDGKTTYNYYGSKAELIASVKTPARYNGETGELLFDDGKVYALDADGNGVTYSVNADYQPLTHRGAFLELEDYDIAFGSAGGAYLYVYDKEGGLIRIVDVAAMAEAEVGMDDFTMWSVKNYLYIQYAYRVHQESNKYDFIDASSGVESRYRLVTKRYDVKKDKVKGMNFDYLVDRVQAISTEYATLEVQKIGSKKYLGAQVFLQTFNEKLKVYVDLQELLPGAQFLAVDGSYVLVGNGAETKVYGDKKELSNFIENSYISYVGNGLFASDNGVYFNEKKEVVFRLTSEMTNARVSDNGILYYRKTEEVTQPDTSVVRETYLYARNLRTGAESKEKFAAVNGGYYLSVTASGGYKLTDGTSDTVIFSDVNLSSTAMVAETSGDVTVLTVTGADGAEMHYIVSRG
ncbi:MAG TPA: hypothetical protein IAB14_04025 [Candidatus Stercoripulliclostridium merdipullorum]|uniref:Lipoprotein n=1 Tax=Candidatus Stercoripulliclostridium merdipullorum TaxID=2840952 RepID=A0A9D1SXV5_9FIRM|nr:hypothetical protein [Candidatus Stercoripulliclostridium merdipullorum]